MFFSSVRNSRRERKASKIQEVREVKIGETFKSFVYNPSLAFIGSFFF
jgi:hypothetical protein